MRVFIEFWIAKLIVDAGLVVGFLLIGSVIAGVAVGIKGLSKGGRS